MSDAYRMRDSEGTKRDSEGTRGWRTPAGRLTAPSVSAASKSTARSRLRLFVSYAHSDEAYRKRLDAHLAPLAREGLIVPWHDRMIQPGSEWRVDIERSLVLQR